MVNTLRSLKLFLKKVPYQDYYQCIEWFLRFFFCTLPNLKVLEAKVSTPEERDLSFIAISEKTTGIIKPFGKSFLILS